MIPPAFKDRFAGDSGVDIARQEIDAVFPDGRRMRVVLRLGAPFEREGRTYIRTEIEDLDRTDGPLMGDGSLHALILGLAWIPGRLARLKELLGCTYYYPDSNEPWDHDALFSVFHRHRK
jgi:hypothetical protein